MEMPDEVLSNIGTKDMDKGGYQVSDVKYIEFKSGEPDLNMDAVLQPGTYIPFSPLTSNKFEMVSMAQNPNVLDEEQDNENPPRPDLSTSPVYERSTQPLCWWESANLEQEMRPIPIMFIEVCLNTVYVLFTYFIINYI